MLIGIIACVGFALPVLADTIRVPGDYPTIQAGIDAAQDGDEVVVDDGVWTGSGNKNLDFHGKAIVVRSENDDPEACIIDCEGEGRGFYLHSDETTESVVKGFTITGADSSGIYCSNSSPTITNCTIEGNTAKSHGGGIYCIYDSNPAITNCTIADNTAYFYDGGGIYCSYRSSPTITNCTITGNTAKGGGGGIYCHSSAAPTITNCAITGNRAVNGGGIYCRSGSNPTITNCTIADNTAYLYGGGIYSSIYSGSNPTITNCTIADNTAYYYGGGIYCHRGAPTITNCTITGNTAEESHGGGIYCSGSDPTITNCTVTGNSAVAGYGGGIYCAYNSKPTITNCILWADTPDEVYVVSGKPVVRYSNVQGGYPGRGNIDADPLWVSGPLGDFYLSQREAGQPEDSPCVDAGKGKAKKLGLKKTTTRTDGKKDKKRVDMGYHYPRR